MLGGRGAGKTRAGAEWVRAVALGHWPYHAVPPQRIALVGETLADARDVMVEGVSGLLAIHAPAEKPLYESTRRRLIWPNGSMAQLFSAEDPDSLRGPQFSAAWCDELCKWRYPDKSWDMLQFGLRLGARPRQVVTTTPRPLPLLKRLLAATDCVVDRAATWANTTHLAPAFLDTVIRRYENTRLGRQELNAEILEDNPHALWRREVIEKARVTTPPALRRIVVAVDPPAGRGTRADACGIIVAGLGRDDLGYVLEDATVQGLRPRDWARTAIAAYHRHGADALVAEVNQGGEMVRDVLAQVCDNLAYRPVHATRGKWLRAEPVAMLYEQGRVRHVGAMAELEDQMCVFEPDGRAAGSSPDRLDALVWALTELMLREPGAPRVRPI